MKDPRVKRSRLHPLFNVIAIAQCAVLAGADGWDAIARFGRARQEWFATFLDLAHGTPSADTFRRVCEALRPAALQERLSDWVQLIRQALEQRGEQVVDGQVVAMDGKAVLGATGGGVRTRPLHLLHFWASESRLLLGQKQVAGAPGEVEGMLELIGQLQLEGAVLTADANGCTQRVAAAAREAKAHYVLQLKGNRGPLHAFVKRRFSAVRRGTAKHYVERHRVLTKGHGRSERRTVWALRVDDWPVEWEGLRTAVMVKRERRQGGRRAVSWHYYVTDLPAQPPRLAGYVRAHWGVENGLHWTLDVCLGEDRRRVRNETGAANLAALGRMALVLLRQEKSAGVGVPIKRQMCGWDPRYMETVLGLPAKHD